MINNFHDLVNKLGKCHLANELGVTDKTVMRWLNKRYNVPPTHFKNIEITLVSCGYTDIAMPQLKKFNLLLEQEKKAKELI